MTAATVTINTNHPLRVAEFETITDGLDYAAKGETGCNFFSGWGELIYALTYRELRERATALARRLIRAGLPPRTRLAIVAETSPDFVVFFFACQYAGVIPIPLPLTMHFGGREAYIERLRGMIRQSGARVAVAPPDLIDQLHQAVEGMHLLMVGVPQDFYGLPLGRGSLRPFGRKDPCYIQYSSGSTKAPRGVLVSQHSLTANVRAIARHGLQIRRGDRCASWLPLYHDMGLIGFCLTPMLCQSSSDYIETASFARRPLTWLKVLSEQGGTVSFSPTFGYHLCVRRAATATMQSLDLSRWRVAGIGGEIIRADVLERFAEIFAEAGFSKAAFVPSYGLAEATLAVSFAPLNRGVEVDRVDLEIYAEFGRAAPASKRGGKRTRSFVICGRPLPNHAVEVRNEHDEILPDRCIGRVMVQGPSVIKGYFQNTAATASVLSRGGWLDTGDLGYMIDDRVVITGRSKDLIIVGGRNIWPEDIEWAVEKLTQIRAGDVAAFSVETPEGAEEVVVVAECRQAEGRARRVLKRDIMATVQRTTGVTCRVVLVPPRSLSLTSSGKLSRAAVKANYLSGALSEIAGEDIVPPPRVAAHHVCGVAAE